MKFTPAIWIKTSFIGLHHWPEAPDSVAYLRDLHRHVFGVRIRVIVKHADRQVEFHALKKETNEVIELYVLPQLRHKPSMSCEMLAELIASNLISRGYEVSAVQVDEDGECGAEVYP